MPPPPPEQQQTSRAATLSTAARIVRAHLRAFCLGLSVGCAVVLLSLSIGNPPSRAARDDLQIPSEVITPELSPPVLLAAADAMPALTASWAPDSEASDDEVELDEIVVRAAAARWQAATNTATQIELETSDVLVSGRAVAAVIMLKRTGSTTGSVRVRCKTVPGSATPTKDYESLSTIVQFGDRQAMSTLFVPILQAPPNGKSRTFSVTLERAPRGPSLGAITTTTVTILGDS